jgi:dTDP-4-dehydrorhamnose reductase
MNKKPCRVLIIGASGMLGNAALRFFSQYEDFETFGTVRAEQKKFLLPPHLHTKIISNIEIENTDSLKDLFFKTNPDIVINCIGIVKQLSQSSDALVAIPVNSLLPHRLASLCQIINARLIHISTDCVFSGAKGMYVESDFPDANDLYGRSKYLGETDYPHAITLRTSMVGHELDGSHSLLGWFLRQQGDVKGYSNAIFSGLPTVEICQIIRDFIIPRPDLQGVYHVSSDPINKFEFLSLVAKVYRKDISIKEDRSLVIDRSLDSTLFRISTGYHPQSWPELIRKMYEFSKII